MILILPPNAGPLAAVAQQQLRLDPFCGAVRISGPT
jgi:hypothetical protein